MEYSMGICKRNSEIASLLGPNNIFLVFFSSFAICLITVT